MSTPLILLLLVLVLTTQRRRPGLSSVTPSWTGRRWARRFSERLAVANIAFVLTGMCVSAQQPPAMLVGMEGRIEVTLPGPRLQPRPVERQAPLLLRIAETSPVAGERSWYDLRYTGMVPGTFDLAKHLCRADGTDAGLDTPIMVQIVGTLSDDHNGQLIEAVDTRPAVRGGYRAFMIVAASTWLVLLCAFVWRMRPRRVVAVQPADDTGPGLAQRMQPLLDKAEQRRLTKQEQAVLERMILAWWREKLGWRDEPLEVAMERLMAHPQAGPEIAQLGLWLHQPPGRAEVDVEALLAPYREGADWPAPGSESPEE